jgi:predicted phosphodiesterase
MDHGAERLFYLGDAVGYIPSPDVLRELRSTPEILALMGNHEAMLLAGDEDCPEVYRLAELRGCLDQDDLAFLRALPAFHDLDIGGHRLSFVHGSPSDPTHGYVYPDTPLDTYRDVTADVVFMGHTHHPFVRRAAGCLFVNVGSCGLPRDDDPRGCVVLYDTDRDEVEFLRFPLGESSANLLAAVDVAEPVARYLRRYTNFKEHP